MNRPISTDPSVSAARLGAPMRQCVHCNVSTLVTSIAGWCKHCFGPTCKSKQCGTCKSWARSMAEFEQKIQISSAYDKFSAK